MWGFASNAITSIGLRRSSSEPSRVLLDSSDDEVCSNSSREEGLECPICLESFNIVENVPHVLWCGHTLCRNCVLALQWAVFRFSTQKFKIPFFISCPWCHLFSLRLVYKGNLKFPRKNFFLLWMVESFNGDRAKFGPALNGENQQISSPRVNLASGNQAGNSSNLRRNHSSCPLLSRYNGVDDGGRVDRHHFSLHKSLDCFIHITSKFPLVIGLLLIVFCVIPGSAIILVLYLLLTVLFAIPSALVLYFAYPTLERLVREITSGFQELTRLAFLGAAGFIVVGKLSFGAEVSGFILLVLFNGLSARVGVFFIDGAGWMASDVGVCLIEEAGRMASDVGVRLIEGAGRMVFPGILSFGKVGEVLIGTLLSGSS